MVDGLYLVWKVFVGFVLFEVEFEDVVRDLVFGVEFVFVEVG